MKYEYEKEFTRVYQEYSMGPVPIREAACLSVQFPAILEPMTYDLLLVGSAKYRCIGFSPKDTEDFGYYCRTGELKELLHKEEDPSERLQLQEILNFWRVNQSKYKTREAYPKEVQRILPSDDLNDIYPAYPLYRMTGCVIDYDKLLRLGVPGLEQEIEQYLLQSDNALYPAMLKALQILKDCLDFYAAVCEKEIVGKQKDRADELQEIMENLLFLKANPPRTFHQAVQLAWLYSLVAHTLDYGRMDVYLGEFLDRDLESGLLDEEKAYQIVKDLWHLIAEKKTTVHGRVMLGGMDRSNPKASDRFALLALRASKEQRRMEPQLSLRCYAGMNQEIFEKALETLAAGATFPILYNDDCNVDNVSKAFGVSREEALDYYPYGCGEYVIGHRSFGSANGVINVARVLELTLSNGRDKSGTRIGLETGEPQAFQSFDVFYQAYLKQLEFYIEALAIQEKVEYEIAGRNGSYLYLSMLYDDCMKRGRGLFDGGIRYLGGTLESYGNITASDSLTSIKEMVFEKKKISLSQLIQALKDNFVGHEEVRRELINVPKYGNDDPISDEVAAKFHNDLCHIISSQAKKVGLHTYLPVLINNDHNVKMGKTTGATADGRYAGAPLTNANSPSGGSDKSGITALLTSMTRLSGDNNAGMVQNLKLGKSMLMENLDKTKLFIKAYFMQGGTQLMITVTDAKELQQAMQYPEQYTNLFVRVGGYSGRFVGLPRDVQLDIISRTAYEV